METPAAFLKTDRLFKKLKNESTIDFDGLNSLQSERAG